ncbi:MAG: UvrD-helicase domain-containing protein [Candidatus Methanoperedens sp.]
MVLISLYSLLPSLNPPQLSSIKQTQPPPLIFAGAGTGKTTTITAKIAYMVEKEGIDPSPDTRAHLLQRSCKEYARKSRETPSGKGDPCNNLP